MARICAARSGLLSAAGGFRRGSSSAELLQTRKELCLLCVELLGRDDASVA
jgi:hypothetical protein